jgi:hypothetical protein
VSGTAKTTIISYFTSTLSNSFSSICFKGVKHQFQNKKNQKMDEFMLIFRHEDGSKIASPEQMQIWMKQTMDWIGSIAAQNKFSSGIGLPMDDSRIVWHNNVVTNGPFGEVKETIGGAIIVKADSIEEAVEFAKGCPVLQGDGNSVEVRKIAKRDGVH